MYCFLSKARSAFFAGFLLWAQSSGLRPRHRRESRMMIYLFMVMMEFAIIPQIYEKKESRPSAGFFLVTKKWQLLLVFFFVGLSECLFLLASSDESVSDG